MLLLGSDLLSRFLNRATDTPFAWGRFDCLLMLADYVAELKGRDPAEHLRGTYSSMLGAAKIVKDSGGMVALVDQCLAPLSIRRASIAARGDIAVVSVASDGGGHFGDMVGSILMTGTAACLWQNGMYYPSLRQVKPVAVWRIT